MGTRERARGFFCVCIRALPRRDTSGLSAAEHGGIGWPTGAKGPAGEEKEHGPFVAGREGNTKEKALLGISEKADSPILCYFVVSI